MIMNKLLTFSIILLALSSICNAYRILVSFPLLGKSHNILGTGIVKILLDAGHEVSFITPFPVKNPHPNLTQIDVSINIAPNLEIALDFKQLLDKAFDPNDQYFLLYEMSQVHYKTIENKNVQDLLHDPQQHFDVVIVEWLFSEFPSGYAAVFDCPYIWFSSVDPHWAILNLVDEATNPSYVRNALSSTTGTTTSLSFVERVQNLYLQGLGYFYREYVFSNQFNEMYEKYYGPVLAKKGRILPPYEELRYNASLVLGNSHISLGQATRIPQNYIPIAGYHIQSKIEPLPKDLKKIMDNAEYGVIYFSMGSNLKSKYLPDEIKKGLLKIFGTLKQTVLWKFEESLPNLPPNVHILEWAPQAGILSHKNCRLFITHGGLLSTTETVHYGVPVIGIPVFADQFNNVNQAVKKGIAKKVDLSYTMADELKLAITDVLSNKGYSERVKELSLIYHDRRVPPSKEVVHWVEHVIRTRGARHLRSPALDVSVYQKMYLDLAALIIVLLLVTYKILIILLNKFLTRTTPKDKKKMQ